MICYRIAPNDLNAVRLLIDRPQTKQNLSFAPPCGACSLGARAFLKFFVRPNYAKPGNFVYATWTERRVCGLNGRSGERRTNLKDDKKRAGGIAPPVFLCYHVIVTQQDSHIEFLGDSCI